MGRGAKRGAELRFCTTRCPPLHPRRRGVFGAEDLSGEGALLQRGGASILGGAPLAELGCL